MTRIGDSPRGVIVGHARFDSPTRGPIAQARAVVTAFGFLDAIDFPFKTVVLAIVAFAALIGLALYSASLEPGQNLTRLGLAFVVGGAAGNLIDRVTAGYVLDFVDLYRGGWHFWAFNVADVAINVGVGLMILELLAPRLGARRAPA